MIISSDPSVIKEIHHSSLMITLLARDTDLPSFESPISYVACADSQHESGPNPEVEKKGFTQP